MPNELSRSDQRLATDALWSAACHAAGVAPSALSPQVRPMPLETALSAMGDADGERFHCTQASIAHVLQGRVLARARRRPRARPAGDRELLRRSLRELSPDVRRQTADKFAATFLRGEEPCSLPLTVDPAVATYSGTRKETSIRSIYLVKRPLDELAELFDPRGWDRCGDLFKQTYRVRDAGGADYPRWDGPEPLGHSWDGLIYERAAAGGYEVEQILRAGFRATRTRGGRVQRVHCDYSLFHTLATGVAGVAYPGLLQRNSGWLLATPEGKGESRVEIVKTLHYGRVSTWSGARGYDIGELFNYLAPAMLLLWTHHMQTVVPCNC